ncbi:MAG: FtsX-like permease family protein [Caldilineaceae bacterium]
MLAPRWHKVFRELWSNRTRTTLVVASVAVGILAVGTVRQLQSVILGEMQALYDASSAAQATVYTGGVNEDGLHTIQRMPEVAEVEGRSTLGLQVQTAPDVWESFTVIAVDDFNDIRVNELFPVYKVDDNPNFGAENTRWPGKDEIVLERGGLSSGQALPPDLRVGSELLLETQDGKERSVTISGLVYDPNGFPAAFTGSATGYVTVETLQHLGGSADFSEIKLRAAGTPEQLQDKDYITQVANSVADKIENGGGTVLRVEVPDVGKLPLQSLFDSLALLLTPLGLLALFLSGFLVINTISALMAQQVRQIGVMKAIGARRTQVIALYLGAVLMYSLLALAVAIPLTALISGFITKVLGGFINVDFPAIALPLNVLAIEVAIGVLIPLLAALYPVLKGTGITVREALSDYGSGAGPAQVSGIAALLTRVRVFSRPLQLSLRNTFRRRVRLILTLFTLVMGGMIFMTVGSVRSSLDNLITKGLDYYQFDIQIEFKRRYRIARVEQAVSRVPGVGIVESWGGATVTRVRPDGTESDPITLTALPADSRMVEPTMIDGRWLVSEDENALVVSQNVLSSGENVAVGDTVNLDISGKESPWVIVGVAQVLGGPPGVIQAYANYDYFAALTDSVERAFSVQIKMAPDATMSQDEMANLLETELEAAGIQVQRVFTIDFLRRITGSFFDIIIYVLLAMGTLIAAVGALGLMGTMSTNVLERTREIGVMRAIGASDGAVLRIVVVEGIVIGLISWAIGAALAYPMGAALATAVGQVLFSTKLPYLFSVSGVITWLVIVAVLAGVASFLPAWNASRLTVREVLAYE